MPEFRVKWTSGVQDSARGGAMFTSNGIHAGKTPPVQLVLTASLP